MRVPTGSVAVVAAWLVSSSAVAQERNVVAFGGGFTFRAASASEARGDSGFGIRWRFGHSETGWGWHYGLGWYSTNLDRNVAGRTVAFGELKIRPILGGYGYTRALSRRVAVSADLVGGFAFSAIEPTPQLLDALRDSGTPSAQIHTSRLTPVLKPEVSAWYDLGHRLGIGVNAGYTIARPNVTIRSAFGQESTRVAADCLSIGVGLVYSIF